MTLSDFMTYRSTQSTIDHKNNEFSLENQKIILDYLFTATKTFNNYKSIIDISADHHLCNILNLYKNCLFKIKNSFPYLKSQIYMFSHRDIQRSQLIGRNSSRSYDVNTVGIIENDLCIITLKYYVLQNIDIPKLFITNNSIVNLDNFSIDNEKIKILKDFYKSMFFIYKN